MIKPATNCDLSTRRHEDIQPLIQEARERIANGFAPPAEIYQIHWRGQIDWSDFPEWARPLDPDVFDGCCHEG